MTRLELYCSALGWQGGTIHQVALELDCTVEDLLYGDLGYWLGTIRGRP